MNVMFLSNMSTKKAASAAVGACVGAAFFAAEIGMAEGLLMSKIERDAIVNRARRNRQQRDQNQTERNNNSYTMYAAQNSYSSSRSLVQNPGSYLQSVYTQTGGRVVSSVHSSSYDQMTPAQRAAIVDQATRNRQARDKKHQLKKNSSSSKFSAAQNSYSSYSKPSSQNNVVKRLRLKYDRPSDVPGNVSSYAAAANKYDKKVPYVRSRTTDAYNAQMKAIRKKYCQMGLFITNDNSGNDHEPTKSSSSSSPLLESLAGAAKQAVQMAYDEGKGVVVDAAKKEVWRSMEPFFEDVLKNVEWELIIEDGTREALLAAFPGGAVLMPLKLLKHVPERYLKFLPEKKDRTISDGGLQWMGISRETVRGTKEALSLVARFKEALSPTRYFYAALGYRKLTWRKSHYIK